MKSTRSRFALESLEARQMLTLAAAGVEFMVNSYTTGIQGVAGLHAAADADGDFVVVLDSTTGDGSSYAVFAQRFNSAGLTLGSEFRVNTYTTGVQALPTVAMDADGDFVIAWMSVGQDGSSRGVFAQRYNSGGVPQGGEFGVNTYTTSTQSEPVVAMDAAGNFVIAWASVQTGDTAYGIYAQRYNFAGIAQGSEFHVNTYTANSQDVPAIAMDAAGDFVVGWRSAGGASLDTSGYGVYARRFNSSGTAQGSEFEVNNFTTGTQQSPSIAMDFTGNFVIAWESQNQDGASWGIYARRYDSAGVAQQASEFQVNTYTTSSQRFPGASADADGDFIISWTSTYQTSAAGVYDVYAKRYNSASVEQPQPTGTTAGLGSEFLVNTYTSNLQYFSAVTMDAKGDAIIAYKGNDPTDTDGGIYAQRYSESVDTAPPIVAGVFVSGKRLLPYATSTPDLQRMVVSFSEDLTTAGGSGGVNSVTNPANWQIVKDGIDITSSLIISNYGFNILTNRYEAELTLAPPAGTGNYSIKARDNLRDTSGNRLDGNADGAPQGVFVLPFSISTYEPTGNEFRVNAYTTLDQKIPAVAQDQSGNFVVVWTDGAPTFPVNGQDGSHSGIYGQRFNASGVAQGSAFQVNTYTTDYQQYPGVAMDANGDFVVVWESYSQEGGVGGGIGIFAQRYNAAGVRKGSEFHVNTFTTGSQRLPTAAMDANGDFVVTWTSYPQDGSGSGVYAQLYSSTGVALGSEFRVNTYTTGDQSDPSVAMCATGEFVIAWSSSFQDGSSDGVYAQRYSATGVAQGTEFRVNTFTPNRQHRPSAAMSAAGDFVVAWDSTTQDSPGEGYGVYAQRYNASGVAQGSEFLVNTYTLGYQLNASVAMDAAGRFVVAWNSDQESSGGIFAQAYSASGVPRDGEFHVNTYTTSFQEGPAVAMDPAGDFVVAWTSFTQDGSYAGVYAQQYHSRLTPTVGVVADNPDFVIAGNTLTLSATGVTDSDGLVLSVSFYRESNGVPGLQVGAEGDTFVATDTTESGGIWSVNVPTAPLPGGVTYTYYAQATDNDGLTGAPASTANDVHAPAGPLVSAAEFSYDTLPQKLKFTFDRDVSGPNPDNISAADVQLTKIGGGSVPTLTMLTYGTDGTNVASFSMNTQLADGNYRATILANSVKDAGNPMAADFIFDFFILGGDANHDRKVDLYDLVAVATNWQGAGKTFSQGDFDYNGVVNSTDLAILAQHWQQNIAPPAPPLPASPTSATSASRAPVRTPARISQLVL